MTVLMWASGRCCGTEAATRKSQNTVFNGTTTTGRRAHGSLGEFSFMVKCVLEYVGGVGFWANEEEEEKEEALIRKGVATTTSERN